MLGSEVTEPQLRCVLPFEAAPAEVGLLRRTAAKQLSRWGVPVAIDEAELLVTELATNVVKHVGVGSSATLVLEWGRGRLRVEVHDKSPVLPSTRTADCEQECGRGLHLVSAMAADWGAVLTAAGKAVWCEVPTFAGIGGLRVERAAGVLERYQSHADGGQMPEGMGLEESAVELIADLLHWTASRGQDPDDFLDRAQRHYEAQGEAA